MRFNEFVFKNTLRNSSLYIAYFFSTLTTVMTFFTFAVFAFHPALNGELHTAVKTGMTVCSVIIFLFSFFYVLYSMDIFLQSRKHEFGLLLIQGMSPKQLRKMVFQENTIIGFIATLVGSFVGIFFSQFILWFSKVSMHVDLGFYFPTKAILLTFVAFNVLFLFISFFIQFKIPKMDVQTLLKSQDLGKGEVKASLVKTILGILLIVVGYGVALYVEGMQVIAAMIPVIVMVILGTRFLFNQASIYVVNFLKKDERRFWKKTNMLVFSDLAFRMKDNARSFFLVAVITTVAFSAIGTLTGFKEMTLKGANSEPFDFSYTVMPDDETGGKTQIAAIETALENQNITAQKVVLSPLSVSGVVNDMTVPVFDVAEYNKVAKLLGEKEIELGQNQAVSIRDKNLGSMQQGMTNVSTFKVTDARVLSVIEQEVDRPIWPTYAGLYLVSSEDFKSLAEHGTPLTEMGWIVEKGSYEAQVKAGKELSDDMTISSKASMIQMITDADAPILFIGLFIGIIFFISAGSFLYFRLYSDMSVDIEKFKMVHKLGFSKKEMKKVVYQQVGILFFTPIIVSTIHGAVALTAMYALFGQGLQMTALYVLGSFVLIQLVYYLVARVFYFNKLYKAVTE